jgi:hypothetical protein
VRRLADGLYRWTARHPEWHPGEFGAEVACYAAAVDGGTLLIDPLVLGDDDAERLDGVVAGRVSILVTIPYHVRSSEQLAARYRGRIHGHPSVTSRLGSTSRFTAMAAGGRLPGGATAHEIGSPRRQETPVFLPSHGALVFGDAVVEAAGRLHVWVEPPVDTAARRRWYRDRLVPSLRPLLELSPRRVLVTHGEPVLRGGRAALEQALDGDAWSRPRAATV